MNKEDKICAFCKYHFIEEISFDSPQSCCKKRKATTEKWLKCDDFEYSDKYVEALQQKVNQLEVNIDKAIEFIDQELQYHLSPFDYKQVDEDINTLIGILRGKE